MNYMKHCDLLRQACPEPMTCSNGCQIPKACMPIVTHERPHQWIKDLVCTAVYAIGIVATLLMAGLAVVYFYARFV